MIRRSARSIAEEVWRDVQASIKRGGVQLGNYGPTRHDPVDVIAWAIEQARRDGADDERDAHDYRGDDT